MKRIQLLELEDYTWFPHWLRACLTRLMVVMHNLLGTPADLAALLTRALWHTGQHTIVDLCSGGGAAPCGKCFGRCRPSPAASN